MSNAAKPGPARPLSPHLQVYRPQLTSMLSIAHRAAGIFLAAGAVYLVFWIGTIASGPDAYASFKIFSGSILGRLLLLGWSVALYYHLANGIRHLFWDAGKGFELKAAYASGWAVLAFTVIATALTWILAYQLKGQ